MCFHASRFNARQTNEDALVLYEQQNEELWDKDFDKPGHAFFKSFSTRKRNKLLSFGSRELLTGIAQKKIPKKNGKIFCNCITSSAG